jgi:hypothetical protein
LFAFLAIWSFVLSPEPSAINTTLGYVGVTGIILMQVYGVYFYRKAKQIHI